MPETSAAVLRRRSPWLALAMSAGIAVAIISLTLLWPSGSTVLDVQGSTPGQVAASFQGPQQCSECHNAEFRDWAGTTHAQASFDPIFQTYLQRAEEPGECFSCHTTGYNAVTGQFVLAGVTCEACHGPYRPEHPGESMAIATSEELCGACHKSTVAEWQMSRHGQIGITCVACHEVHTQKARVPASTNLLCKGCHQSQTQDSVHREHDNAGIHCVDCHLVRPEDMAPSAVAGHATTAHSFTTTEGTCQRCHDPIP